MSYEILAILSQPECVSEAGGGPIQQCVQNAGE